MNKINVIKNHVLTTVLCSIEAKLQNNEKSLISEAKQYCCHYNSEVQLQDEYCELFKQTESSIPQVDRTLSFVTLSC